MLMRGVIGGTSLCLLALTGLQSMALAADSDSVLVGVDGLASGGSATVTVGATHGSATSGGTGAGQGSTSTSERTRGSSTCTYKGHEIGCTSSAGVWSPDRQCYVQRVSPQPDPDAPVWNGHTEGTIYQCTPPGAAFSAGTGVGYWFWAPSAGEDGSPTLVDPVTLAEEAIERMRLVAPRVGMTPVEDDAPLLVGMDAWLWVANDGPRSVGPITRTATAGPTSVTATAEVSKVVWDMGDGTRLTCRNAGTPWTPERGTGPSPTCGHRYLQPSTDDPGGTFTVRATAHWRVDWDGAGQSGRITFTMSGTRELAVSELQVLQTR
jgi:YD repeat-containing protein